MHRDQTQQHARRQMNWTTEQIGDLSGRVALVTGANSGLGLQTSRALAAAGCRVLMACRNPQKGQAALAQLQQELGAGATLQLLALDLASLDSVRRCAEQVLGEEQALDLLINNAGVMAVPQGWTVDGFETQIGTNHFGHFALTLRLLPLLRRAAAARVVTVSSMAHRWTPGLDFSDIDWRRRSYRRWQAYGDSKLANLYFSFELARRLDGSGIKAVAAHPGYADTHLQYVAAEEKNNPLEKGLMWLGNGLFAQPAAMGALPSLYAACDASVDNGDFIGPDGFRQTRGYPRKVGARRLARHADLARQLWTESEQRCEVSWR